MADRRQTCDAKRKETENAEPVGLAKKQRICCIQEKDSKRKCIDNAEPNQIKRQRVDGVQEKGPVGSPVQMARVEASQAPGEAAVRSQVPGLFASRSCAINYSTIGQTLAASSREDAGDTEMKDK